MYASNTLPENPFGWTFEIVRVITSPVNSLVMFERYSEQARRALFFARYDASILGIRQIEPEHVLLGLIREGKGVAYRLIAELSAVSPLELKAAITSSLQVGQSFPTSIEIPFSQACQEVLIAAATEADLLQHADISSEHLLLAILRQENSGAAEFLKMNGMEFEAVRRRIIALRQA